MIAGFVKHAEVKKDIQFETSKPSLIDENGGLIMIDYQKTVKDLLDKLIMTQAEFADMLVVSFASINRWKNGLNRPTATARKQIVQL